MYKPGDLVFFDRDCSVAPVQAGADMVSESMRATSQGYGYKVKRASAAIVVRPYEKSMTDCGTHFKAYVVYTPYGIGWAWVYDLIDS